MGSTKHPEIPPPEHDPVYATVLRLRGGTELRDAIRTTWRDYDGSDPGATLRVRILQTHYKPRERARLLVETEVAEPDHSRPPLSQPLYLQVFPTAGAARRRFEKAQNKPPRKCHGPPVFLLEALQAVVWSLPNAPRLGPAQVGFCPRKLAKLLRAHYVSCEASSHRPRLVRYVPRKRALFRFEPRSGRPLYLKFYAPPDDERAANNLEELQRVGSEGGHGFRYPRLVFHSARRRVVAMEEVAGAPLTCGLADPRPDTFAAVGRAVAGLHSSGVRTLDSWSARGELEALVRALRDVRIALPAISPELDPLVKKIEIGLEGLPPLASTPIHGNLFGDQILIDGKDDVSIVDWDDLASGDPNFDVGRLLAHLLFEARRRGTDPSRWGAAFEAMLNGYRERGALEPRRLRWHVAVGLLMRSKISSLRTLAEGWIEEVVWSVREAAQVLRGDSHGRLLDG